MQDMTQRGGEFLNHPIFYGTEAKENQLLSKKDFITVLNRLLAGGIGGGEGKKEAHEQQTASPFTPLDALVTTAGGIGRKQEREEGEAEKGESELEAEAVVEEEGEKQGAASSPFTPTYALLPSVEDKIQTITRFLNAQKKEYQETVLAFLKIIDKNNLCPQLVNSDAIQNDFLNSDAFLIYLNNNLIEIRKLLKKEISLRCQKDAIETLRYFASNPIRRKNRKEATSLPYLLTKSKKLKTKTTLHELLDLCFFLFNNTEKTEEISAKKQAEIFLNELYDCYLLLLKLENIYMNIVSQIQFLEHLQNPIEPEKCPPPSQKLIQKWPPPRQPRAYAAKRKHPDGLPSTSHSKKQQRSNPTNTQFFFNPKASETNASETLENPIADFYSKFVRFPPNIFDFQQNPPSPSTPYMANNGQTPSSPSDSADSFWRVFETEPSSGDTAENNMADGTPQLDDWLLVPGFQ
jgi:hypothetical protein